MDALLVLTSDPVKLGQAMLPPNLVVFCDVEVFGSISVMLERRWLFHEVGLDLLWHLWQLIHVIRASMVLLILGVLNGIVEALLKGL